MCNNIVATYRCKMYPLIKPTTQHEGIWLTDLPAPTMITAAELIMKASKVILYATSALLVLIWMSAFIISYVSLVAVATVGGLTYPGVWLWPLLLDAFMCSGSLDVIRRELNGETTTIAWAVVIGVTLVSTGFTVTLAGLRRVKLGDPCTRTGRVFPVV